MSIKEEPIDIDDGDNQVQTCGPAFHLPMETSDVKWWKKVRLDSSDISSANPRETNQQHQIIFVDEITGELRQAVQNSPEASLVTNAPSSLPASQTWPGEYGFTVSFSPQSKNTKGVAWTYSKIKDKLYVGKDVPCPVNFSTDTVLPNDAFIRVVALYSSPEQVSEVVKRCVNHSTEDKQNGVNDSEHLIRCGGANASYHVDPITGRHSVTVPFENPPVGQQFSTYIYQFMCFGSCAGGPNRRPLMLIFTLERGNQVIGRRKLDVKICACPGRDRKIDESQCVEMENTRRVAVKRKESDELMNLSDALDFTKSVYFPPLKKSKPLPNKDGCYTVTAETKGCYEFLLHMLHFYEMCDSITGLSPEGVKILQKLQKKENNEE